MKYHDPRVPRVVSLNLNIGEMQACNAEWENKPQHTMWILSQVLEP